MQVVGSVALDVAETDGRALPPDERDRIAARRRSMNGVDPAMLPRTAAAAGVVAACIGEDRFRWALPVVLDGIVTRAAASSEAP